MSAKTTTSSVNNNNKSSQFAFLKASEEVRSRHSSLKLAAQRCKDQLEVKISSGEVKGDDPASPENTERAKQLWYLEKLANVLNVQEKLLDNRVGCTFRSSEQYVEIMSELDKFESFVNEITEKCSAVSM